MAGSPDVELGIARLCAMCREAVFFQDNDEAFEETLDDDGLPYLVFPQEYDTSEPCLVRTDTFPDLPRLDDSSHKGCDFCGFLRDIIRSTDTKDALRKEIGKSLDDIETRNVSIYVYYRRNSDEDEYRCDGVSGMLVDLDFDEIDVQLSLLCLAEGIPGEESTTRWLGLAAPSIQSYLNEHSIKWMVKRLEGCTKHKHESKDGNFIPERLVDVQEPNPRLVLRGDLQDSGTQTPVYTTLSYCWGSLQDAKSQLKTTAASIAQRQVAITDHEMTAVLRDAIAVTRALSIPYLWVDALCILQDDNDTSDWELQSTNMSKIYSNAYVTLCAGSSTSSHEGFLCQRGNRIRIPFQSARPYTITGSYFLQFKYANATKFPIQDDMYNDLRLCRWGSRGWVFQEVYSSTRILLFGNSNIHFFCDRSYATMGGESFSHPYMGHLSLTRDMGKDELYNIWEQLLLNYSKFAGFSFSVATDILPALSGLAMHFCGILQDYYFAGLWKGNLLRHLMWYRGRNVPNRSTYFSSLHSPEIYLIPSWSMIGRGYSEGIGNISTYFDLQPESVQLDAKTELVGSNRFGAIKSGQLDIHSHVLDLASLDRAKLTITKSPSPSHDWLLKYDSKHVGDFNLDFAYTSFNHEVAGILGDIESFSWVLLGSCRVKHWDEPENKASRIRGAFGLILYTVPNSDKFYRVGVFFPGQTKEHGEGLRLFTDMGKVRKVVVI